MGLQTYGSKPFYLKLINIFTKRKGWVYIPYTISLKNRDINEEEW